MSLLNNPLGAAQCACSLAQVHATKMAGALIAYMSMPQMANAARPDIEAALAAFDDASAKLRSVLETMEGG